MYPQSNGIPTGSVSEIHSHLQKKLARDRTRSLEFRRSTWTFCRLSGEVQTVRNAGNTCEECTLIESDATAYFNAYAHKNPPPHAQPPVVESRLNLIRHHVRCTVLSRQHFVRFRIA